MDCDTMAVKRPKLSGGWSMAYGPDYPEIFRREIPAWEIPLVCDVCGADLLAWRVELGFDSLCVDCQRQFDAMEAFANGKVEVERKPLPELDRAGLVRLLAWSVNPQGEAERERLAFAEGRKLRRIARHCILYRAAYLGADVQSPVTRQTAGELLPFVLVEYLSMKPAPKQSVWMRMRFAVRRAWYSDKRTDDGKRQPRVVVASDGALVLAPLVPRQYRPVLSYTEDAAACERLLDGLQSVMASLGVGGSPLDFAAALSESQPALMQSLARRYA